MDESLSPAIPTPEVLLIDEDSDAFLRIRGSRQGQELLERCLLTNDIEGVRYYLAAMAEKWYVEAAETLGKSVYKEDLISANPGAPTFLAQVQAEMKRFPAIEEHVFDQATPLSKAVSAQRFEQAALLMAAGFLPTKDAISSVLTNRNATADDVAWMQAAAPLPFSRAIGLIDANTLLSASVSEEKLHFVLDAVPRVVKEKFVREPVVSLVLNSPRGVATARVLSEHGIDLNGGALHSNPRLYSGLSLSGSDSPADAAFFKAEIGPYLASSGKLISYRDLEHCGSLDMLKAALPLVLPIEKGEGGPFGIPGDPTSLVDLLADKPNGREMIEYLKAELHLQNADHLPALTSSRGSDGEKILALRLDTVVILEQFGPKAMHKDFGMAEHLAVVPAPERVAMSRLLTEAGYDVRVESFDPHKAIAALIARKKSQFPDGAYFLDKMVESPALLGTKNDKGHTVMDAMLISGLSTKGLPANALGYLSKEIDGAPAVHAYVLGAGSVFRVDDWLKVAPQYGLDVTAVDSAGRTAAAILTAQGNLDWNRYGSGGTASRELLGAIDNEGNSLLHTIATHQQRRSSSGDLLLAQIVDKGGIAPDGKNKEGKTPLDILGDRLGDLELEKPGISTPLKSSLTNARNTLDKAVKSWKLQREEGFIAVELVGLSENGQRGHLKFSLVQAKDGLQTVTDITSKAAELLKKRDIGGSFVRFAYEAKAKAAEIRVFLGAPNEGESPSAFRNRAGETIHNAALTAVQTVNATPDVLSALRDHVEKQQQAVAKAATKALPAKTVSTGLSV